MFQFKQFTIRQDRTPMKVGTDGVLLGAWAATEKALTILDAGTGTGVIALMSAQRNPLARIDAIEIEPDACRQAIENIRASRWKERIQVWESALQTFSLPIFTTVSYVILLFHQLDQNSRPGPYTRTPHRQPAT